MTTHDEKVYAIKYIELINNFLIYGCEHLTIHDTTKKINYLIRGLNILHNVFNTLFFYTKNIDLVSYHCQKSYSYYTEFISQIELEENNNLQLTIKDAIVFIYKKTVLDIQKDYIKNIQTSKEEKRTIQSLLEITEMYNELCTQYVYYFLHGIDTMDTEKISMLCDNIIEVIKKILLNDDLLDKMNAILYLSEYVKKTHPILSIEDLFIIIHLYIDIQMNANKESINKNINTNTNTNKFSYTTICNIIENNPLHLDILEDCDVNSGNKQRENIRSTIEQWLNKIIV